MISRFPPLARRPRQHQRPAIFPRLEPLEPLTFLSATPADGRPTRQPTLDWVVGIGSEQIDGGSDVATDNRRNAIIVGEFRGTAIFGPGTTSLTAAGEGDGYITKYDADGNLLWVRGFGSTGEDAAVSVAADNQGAIYVTGIYEGTVTFGAQTLTSAGGTDAFILKLDADGNVVWARSVGAGSSEAGLGIAVDQNRNVYLTGGFFDTVDFDPGSGVFELTSAGGSDPFILKLDSAGNFVWARAVGGADPGEIGQDIAVDPRGNVYSTGLFFGPADFDPGPDTSTLEGNGLYDAFVLKLDRDGEFVWAGELGGPGNDRGFGIAAASSGNIFVAGDFRETADFDPGSDTFTLTSAGGQDAFIAQLDSDGDLLWARSFGGSDDDTALSIAADSRGNAYVTGIFVGTATFQPDSSGPVLTSAGEGDIYAATFSRDGQIRWAVSMGGEDGDSGRGIAVSNQGDLFIAGNFRGTADFDPGSGTTELTSRGQSDAFLAKLQSKDGKGKNGKGFGSRGHHRWW